MRRTGTRCNRPTLTFSGRGRTRTLTSFSTRGVGCLRPRRFSSRKVTTTTSRRWRRGQPRGHWENLGGEWGAANVPAAVSWGGQRMDLFYMSRQGGSLQHRNCDGGKWNNGGWQDIGGQVDSTPAAISRGRNCMDVYVKGADGQCWRRNYDHGGGWDSWESLGGDMVGMPAAVSWGGEHTSVFAVDKNGRCYHRLYLEGKGGWADKWEAAGGHLNGPPTAVSWGQRPHEHRRLRPGRPGVAQEVRGQRVGTVGRPSAAPSMAATTTSRLRPWPGAARLASTSWCVAGTGPAGTRHSKVGAGAPG